jgi:hypothetical protein
MSDKKISQLLDAGAPKAGDKFIIARNGDNFTVDGALLAVPGPTGPTGTTGATGATGPAGANGQGVPVGGTTGQVLSKKSLVDFDTQWVSNNASIPVGINQRRRIFADFTEGRAYNTANVSVNISGGFSYYSNVTSCSFYMNTSVTDLDTHGSLVFNSGATAGFSAKIATNYSGVALTDKISKYETRHKFLQANIDDINWFFGLDQTSGPGAFRNTGATTGSAALGFFVAPNSPVPGNYAVIARRTGSSGNGQTVMDTGVPYLSGSFDTLRIEVSKASAKFYINGVLKNTITTNIETNPARPFYAPSISVSRTAGTTNADLFETDYVEWIPDTTWWGLS